MRKIVLETERLILRHFSQEDAPFILTLLNEPAYLKNIGDKNVRTIDDAVIHIKDKFISQYETDGYGLYLAELKTDPHSSQKENLSIGMYGIFKREKGATPEIGYAFLAEHQGKGYATEAGHATLLYAKQDLGLKNLVALTSPTNQTSMNVLGKLGFKFEKEFQMEGYEDKSCLFSISLE